jgi:serine/threonine protein kinase
MPSTWGNRSHYGEFKIIGAAEGHPKLLGEGSFGKTFEAERFESVAGQVVREPVALKVLNPELLSSASKRLQFVQERTALTRLKHANLVHSIKCGEDKGDDGKNEVEVFFAMELCMGGDLSRLVKRFGALPERVAALIGLQAASGLREMHRRDLVHRDIKPPNVMLFEALPPNCTLEDITALLEENESLCRIVDFGLVGTIASERETSEPRAPQKFVGSMMYASPEQIQERKDIDGRTDIYALGMTLWFLVQGRGPLLDARGDELKHASEAEGRHLSSNEHEPDLPNNLSREFRSILAHMVAKNPENRVASAKDLVIALEHYLERSARAREPSLPPVQSRERMQSIFSFEAGFQKNIGRQRYSAINLYTQQRVRLTIVEDMEGADYIRPDFDDVVRKLRGLVQTLRQCDVPKTILPVHEVIYAADALAYTEDLPGDVTLAEVLQSRTAFKRPFSFREAEVIFRPIAEALDHLINRGWEFVSLPCEEVWLSDIALASNPQDKNLMCRPLDHWTGLRVSFSGMWIPPHKDKDSGEDMLYASTAGTGSSFTSEDSLRAPVSAFLRLVYRTLSGSDVPEAADRWPNGYIPSVALQTASNNLIRDLLCKQREWAAVTLILNELCADEGVSVDVPVVPLPVRGLGRGSSGTFHDSKRGGSTSAPAASAGTSKNSSRTSSATQFHSAEDPEVERPSPLEARDAPDCEIISVGVVRLGEHLQELTPLEWVSGEFVRCAVTRKWYFFPPKDRPLFPARVDRPKYAFSPYSGVEREVDWSEWKPGGTIICAETQYPFRLPDELPLPVGKMPPEGAGRVISYFDPSGPPITVAANDWVPGAQIICPKTHHVFVLPERLPPLEAKIDHDKPGWLHSPYDPEAAWNLPTMDWTMGREVICDSTGKRLILPSGVEQWVAEAIVLDSQTREVQSPYERGAKCVVPAMEWRSGGKIKCPPGGRTALLPQNLPPLVGQVVPGSPGVIRSPFSSEMAHVPFPSWVAGKEILCSKSGLPFLLPPGLPIPDGSVLKDKPGLAFSPYDPSRTVNVNPLHWLPGEILTCPTTGERFKLPDPLPPLHALLTPGDPGLVRSPFAPDASDEVEVDFEFRIPIEDWVAGNTFDCPVTKHHFALPSTIEEWIQDGTWVPGTPGRVRSPFKNGGEVKLSNEQWKPGTIVRCPIVGRRFRAPISEDFPSLSLEKAAVQQAQKSPEEDEVAAAAALKKEHSGATPAVILSIWERHRLDTIERRMVSEEGILVDGKPGMVISPYTKKEMVVPPETWMLPGASMLCESGKMFLLPPNRPRLVGTVEKNKPGFVASPFDPGNYFRVSPWQWLPETEITCERTGHPFELPRELPDWEPEAILDSRKPGYVINPYSSTRELLLIRGSDWRPGTRLSDGGKFFLLPDKLPPLVADLDKLGKGKVESPYSPGTVIPVSPEQWVAGATVVCPATSMDFRLPDGIPQCDFEGTDPHEDGTIQSPYGRGARFSVQAIEWIGGADVICPETGKKVVLPKDLPILVGTIDAERPCEVVSPFDPDHWMPVDIADWIEAGELRCQKTHRTFRLPEERLPLPIADLASGQPGTVLSPFRNGAEILVPPMQWLGGGEVEDRTVRRRFRLPKSGLPFLEGITIAGRTLLIISPFDLETEVVVPRSDWLVGHEITCPTTKRVFTLPRHLEPAGAGPEIGQAPPPPLPPNLPIPPSTKWLRRLKWPAVAALFLLTTVFPWRELDTIDPPPQPPPPTSPYNIVLSGKVYPQHAEVLLDGKPLSFWGGKIPADSKFPVKISVTAGGYLPVEISVDSASKEREIPVKLPVLSRSSGSFTYKLPSGAIDYTQLQLSWLHPLPAEEKAELPAASTVINLPQGFDGASRPKPELSMPTGTYRAILKGTGPIPDLTFEDPVLIHPKTKVVFDKIPPTLAGVYTCYQEIPKTLPNGTKVTFQAKRVFKLGIGLRTGSHEESLIGGPNTIGQKNLNYPVVYNPHGVSNLRFDRATGISGTILRLDAGELADETFCIFRGQIFLDPHIANVKPFTAPIAHEALTAE